MKERGRQDDQADVLAREEHSIAGELYAVSYATLREGLLPREPVELELGIIELDDGPGSLAMRMRAEYLTAPGIVDISASGGWRAHRG